MNSGVEHSVNSVTGFLADEAATEQFAVVFAEVAEGSEQKRPGLVIFLQGDLGAGKSFFSRCLIQSFLPNQKVKSPTYTLVESYPTTFGTIQHFDLYRLCDPEELEFLAFRDLLDEAFLTLIEWPSKGLGVLPTADMEILLTPEGEGRKFVVKSLTYKGNLFVKNLSKQLGTVFVR